LVVPFLEKVFGNATDADIWDTAYSLVSRATTRPTDLRTSTTTRVSPSDFVLHDLQKDWTSPYFPDSLDALDRLIRDFESQDTRREYYARTLVFVQSSGMGKSRLADAFGKTCPMINFVLREQGTHGFPPTDGEILSFVRMPLSMGHREVMANSPSKKADSSDGFLDRRAVVVWNHSVAVGLLQASFEKCELVHFWLF
jgi:hypothetical protein